MCDDSDRAYYYWPCVFIKDRGRRLPLELECSLYQGQQHGVNQPAGKKKLVLRGTKSNGREMHHLISVDPVSHIYGGGRGGGGS